MTAKIRDTFYNNYASGTISSPTKINIDEILDWFSDNNIIAGVSTTNNKTFEFFTPMKEHAESYRSLIGTADSLGKLDYRLLPEQLALDLAKTFAADVYFAEDGSADYADWTNDTREKPPANTFTYIVSKAPSESAMASAHSIKQSIEYARIEQLSLWCAKEYGAAWYDHAFMPRELPAFIFSDDFVMVQYKTLSEPIHLHAGGEVVMSYNDADAYNLAWKGTRAETAMNEIAGYQLRPGGDIDNLIRAGVLKKSRAEQLLDVLSGDQKDFVAGVCKVFDLPQEIAQHITAGTMPKNSQTAKVSGWFKLISRTVDEYAYEPDPHAGPIKRFYAYVSARPLLDWTWMIGEFALGLVMAYYFLISQLGVSQPWWHYILGVIGIIFVFESLIGMYLMVKRRLK